MASALLKFKPRPVEIIINDHSIRYIELKNSEDKRPLKWGERYLPPGIVSEGKILDTNMLSIILEECIDVWKIKRRRVRYLVPDPFITVRKVPIPADVHIDEIEGYLYLEIGESVHLPFEDPVFDYVVLPQEGEKHEILLFAAHREHVMTYADLFSSVKLKPDAADVSSLALYRLYHHLTENTDESLLIIQFDLDLVNMSIFENKMPLFTRHHQLPFDHKQWDTHVARTGFQQLTYKGDIEELAGQFDEVTKEINMMIDFYQFSLNQGKNELSKILLTGDHPMLNSILKELEKRFEIPVELLDSSSLNTEKNRPLPASHHLALGLALKEV
ncbi:pilus assembly protein PilM [Mesobacillus campisalis]|uniref:Pilus assembly protein PilM n=1 Tax=Mesobacillus campisalis TaxID=1408103 RepID=A0A0M2SFJ5_9BACI|nr:pilus assembly protein PilM [Mesobacillus campisalis]KKK33058.1 pilus assembly protein PilM [Mesobacillus campisalis]